MNLNINIDELDFTKPIKKNDTFTLDTRVIEKIKELSEVKDVSKSKFLDKVLLKVFEIE